MIKDRKFDTTIQVLKYRTLRAVIKALDNHVTETMYIDIPKEIVPGPKPTMRCCIYKERAILGERIKIAMGGDKTNPNTIEVIKIACDECPAGGIYVTPACRGCLLHACADACPKDAIYFDKHQHAVIDKEKCIECGRCVKACPYNAIIAKHRPCMEACPVKAITMDDDKRAEIDNNKCVECGKCLYMCPFGAIQDKSEISQVVDVLNKSGNNENYKVYAVIAPSIVSQFKYAKIEQVISGIIQLGFHQVVEAALGADVTLYKEANEWIERKVMTTSCCPSFVMFIEKHYPELAQYVSHSPSPMIETARLIKRNDKTAKVVFIGPCSSKKKEHQLEKTKNAVDNVISFEELQAFLDARNIDITALHETALDNASFYGRIFAKSGGIAQGISEVGKTLGIEGIKPLQMNGLDECKVGMIKLKFKKAEENFFEGMACEGGCINGALCLTHDKRNIVDVDKYGNDAKEKTIDNSVLLYNLAKEHAKAEK
ncbi:MAG: 4Fe-4S dicluster domain-containing protein [Clostridia bacterium]